MEFVTYRREVVATPQDSPTTGRRRTAVVASAALALALSAGAASANLLDEIGSFFQGLGSSVESAPMEQVAPGRPHRRAARRHERTSVRAVAIDPVADPEWFLHDPTLRRGDILVLADRVVVYEGAARRARHGRADFASLAHAPSVSRTDRWRVARMAGPMGRTAGPLADAKTEKRLASAFKFD